MLVAFAAQMPPPCAQWIAMATKSVSALARAAVPGGDAFDANASFHSGEPVPKASDMSPKGPVPVFSSSMFASEMAPKSHPARVKEAHGAGVFFCSSVTMFASGSLIPVLSSTRSVQYLNAELNAAIPLGGKYP